MNETLKPLNSDAFGEDSLLEGEGWLCDAFSSYQNLFVRRIKSKAGLIGSANPNWKERPCEHSADELATRFRNALRDCDLIAYAIHPQTYKKHIVDANRWSDSMADLAFHYGTIKSHLTPLFEPFLNRKLRINGERFLLWLGSEGTRKGLSVPFGNVEGFKHIATPSVYATSLSDLAYTPRKQQKIPYGFVSISDIFVRAFVFLYPEHSKQDDWPFTPLIRGKAIRRVPPKELLEIWEKRNLYGDPKALNESNWIDCLNYDVAYRLYLAIWTLKQKAYYFDERHSVPFELPAYLLDPAEMEKRTGDPWASGILHRSRNRTEYDTLEGVTCCIEKTQEETLWAALLAEVDPTKTVTTDENADSCNVEIYNVNSKSKRTRAKDALIEIYGSRKRPDGITQEAAHSAVNEHLKRAGMPTVSITTVIRALGDRN